MMNWEWTAEMGTAGEILKLIAAEMEKNGFVVLRSVLKVELVESLRRDLSTEFSRLWDIRNHLSESLRLSLERNEMPAHDEMARFRLEPTNYRHLTGSEALVEIIEFLAGSKFYWHFPTQFREMDPKNSDGILPFHQDYSYNSRYPKMIVSWVPLDDCGLNAPGLEIVGKNLGGKFVHSADGRWEHGISENDVRNLIGEYQSYRPVMKRGDVILFNERTLHRTFVNKEMVFTRMSQDARAIPMESISAAAHENRWYIDPRTGMKVKVESGINSLNI